MAQQAATPHTVHAAGVSVTVQARPDGRVFLQVETVSGAQTLAWLTAAQAQRLQRALGLAVEQAAEAVQEAA